jgi:hypothetical protein
MNSRRSNLRTTSAKKDAGSEAKPRSATFVSRTPTDPLRRDRNFLLSFRFLVLLSPL